MNEGFMGLQMVWGWVINDRIFILGELSRQAWPFQRYYILREVWVIVKHFTWNITDQASVCFY